MLSHYLFDERYGCPGKGNEKGHVEGLVGWFRRNMMVPLPKFPDIESVNAWLEEPCCKRQSAVLHGHTVFIADRLQRDLGAMRSLPLKGHGPRQCALPRGATRATTTRSPVPMAFGM